MAAKSSYSLVFVPILALLLVGVVSLLAMMLPELMKATPQETVGAAQIMDTASPAEQYASVTTAAKPLAPSEEARPLPQGQPLAQPAGGPGRSPQRSPDSGAR